MIINLNEIFFTIPIHTETSIELECYQLKFSTRLISYNTEKSKIYVPTTLLYTPHYNLHRFIVNK